MRSRNPRLIRLDRRKRARGGFLAGIDCSAEQLPFEVRRVFWLFETPRHCVRGDHAHRELEQVLVAMAGGADVELENIKGETARFALTDPTIGLYVPPMHWARISLAEGAVMLCFASRGYDERDYVRDYSLFRSAEICSMV